MSRKSCEVSPRIFHETILVILPMSNDSFSNSQPLLDESGNETVRSLGLVVARGTLLVLISPADGSEEIANPFVQPEE
jgi:hypothetical protein